MVKNYLKQFTAWATGSRNNLFLWARLKLTFLYIVYIAMILVVFSVGLYINISRNVKDNIDDKIKDKTAQQLAIDQTDDQLQKEFAVGDLILLIISGGLAFFMAEKNLQPIRKAMDKQKRFTADASHDLRTPLAIMKTDCEVSLKKKDVSAGEFRELIKSNLEEVDRMSAMVEQLLFLSRNNNALKQEMEKIPLGKLTGKMVDSFRSLADNKNIALFISEISEVDIKGNRLDLERMFFNILKNAIDYTLAGGNIVVSLRKNNDQAILSIKDNGVGISPDDLSHITEAFYKADKVRSEECGGSGLGLSIVEGIVENHHGKLVIDSELGVGTEIRIILPLLSS